MKILLIAIGCCSWLSVALAAPHHRSRAVSVAAVQKLKAPLTIAAVEKAFGPSTGQPGPRVSYPSADYPGMSLWFWIRSPERFGVTSKTDLTVGCVILATTVREEKPLAVWPPEAVGESLEKLISQVNATYESKAK